MTKYELITSTVSIISVVLVLIGVIYAGIQLYLLRKVNKGTHDWNRRISAQNAISSIYANLKDRYLLNEKFEYLDIKSPIPLEEINKVFLNDNNLRLICDDLLNYYEMLARGVFEKIYDRKVIENARKSTMIQTFNAFSLYIKDQRNYIPDVWNNMEAIVNDWKSDDTKLPDRKKTG